MDVFVKPSVLTIFPSDGNTEVISSELPLVSWAFLHYNIFM